MPDFRATNLIADAEVFAQSILNVRDWGNLLNKPTSFTPSAHTHSAADITTGTFTVGTFAANVNITGSLSVTGSGTFGPPSGGVGNFPAATLRGGVDASTNASFVFEISDTGATGLAPKNLLVRGTSSGSDIAFAPASGLEANPSLVLRAAGGVEMSGALTVTGQIMSKAMQFQFGTGGGEARLVFDTPGFGSFYINGAEVGRITSGAVLAWGTTVTAGAAGGDVVLATSKYLRAVNAAGTGTTRVIAGSTVGGNDMVSINPDAVGVIGLGAVTSVGGAGAGDVVLANSRDIRFVNNLGNGTIEGLTVLGGSDNIYVGREAGAIVLGNAATSTGAAVGDIVIGNGKMLHAVNSAGTGLHVLIRSSTWNSLDVTQVAYSSVLMVGSPNLATNAGAGEIVLGNAKAVRASNSGGTGTVPMVDLNSSNMVQIGSGGAAVVLGTSLASALGANSGDVVLANSKALRFVNGGGTSTIAALLLNASNDLHLGYNTNHSQYGLAVEGAALTAEQTAVHLLCNIGGVLSVKQVLVGAADSDGAGFRSLRIAN